MTDETKEVRHGEAAGSQSEDARPAADAAAAPLGFGAALRNAREAAGMAASELAARLHLHPRQLDALEEEDFAALPEPIYIRGYLRGCGRELRIDVAPLLADLDHKVQAEAASPPERMRMTRVVVSSSAAGRGAGAKRVAVAIAALAVLLGVVAIAIRLPHGGPHRHAAGTPSASAPRPSSADGAAAPAPATATAPTPRVSAPTVADPLPTRGDGPAGSPASPASVPAPATTPAATPPAASNATAVGSAGAAMASAAAVAAQDASVLTLRTTANVWIDVSDSGGRTLLSQVVPGGSVQTVSGAAPLHLIVGKVSAVTAEFRGHAVNLRAHAGNGDVARLTLE